MTPPPATITSRLTEEQQDAVSARINRAIAGIKTATDPETFYAIHQGLSSDDDNEWQRWAAKNLTPFTGRLCDNDLAALEKLQAVDDAEQRRLQASARIANDALRRAGIDPTPQPDAPPGSDAAQAARFNRLVHDKLSTFEKRGRKPTEAEAYDIVVGLKDTALESGWLKVSGSPASPAVDSDIPSTDDPIHEPGAELAQAGPQDDKAEATRSGPAATEPDPGSAVYRDADRQARGIVAEQEIQEIENDRAVSSWMTGIRPDAPVPELPREIAERLRPDRQEEIQDVLDAGTSSRSDPATFEKIFLGLTSDDAGERLKWAREPLYSYRPQLSEKDYANLVLIQRNISARAGIPIEGVGYPLGTLDDHAELAAALLTVGVGGTAAIASAGQAAVWIARQAVRAGRWALEKIKGKDEPPPRRDVLTEGVNPTGIDGLTGKAAEIAVSAPGTSGSRGNDRLPQEQVFETLKRVREEPGQFSVQDGARVGSKELAAREALNKLGLNVIHQRAAGDAGIRDLPTADLNVEGIGGVEVYSPQPTTTLDRVITNIQNKHRQASTILVQGAFTETDMQLIATRLWGRPSSIKIETLLFQLSPDTIVRVNRPGK